jgi:hypothetical protein
VSSPDDTPIDYLRDLVYLLVEQGNDALRAAESGSRSAEEVAFEAGKAFGTFQALSLIKNQAIAFGISLRKIKLDKIDIDRELVRSCKALRSNALNKSHPLSL